MSVQIGAKPDSGFDDPIGMLKDCHRRIERFLRILCVVANTAAGRALTDEETSAVQSALEYFRTGGQRHTADEEGASFPGCVPRLGQEALTRLAGWKTSIAPRTNCITRWRRSTWHGWLQAHKTRKTGDGLGSAVNKLEAVYVTHIEVEDGIVFLQRRRDWTARLLQPLVRNFMQDGNDRCIRESDCDAEDQTRV